MTRRIIRLLVILILSFLAVPLVAEAQLATRVYRIGWLISGNPPAGPDSNLEAFRQGLHDLGYVEGQNLVMEGRSTEGRVERLPDLAAELVRLQVEVLVARGAPAIRAAQHATRTIPVVMAGTSDAVEQGFVASLARPGGNITGVSWLGAELPGKRLELLKELVPQRARIAVLANPANPYYASRMHNLTEAARGLGLHLHVVEVRQVDELPPAFAALPQARADALLVMEDALVLSTSLDGRIAALAATSRLPAMYGWLEYVAAGGLMSYGPSFQDIHRRAGVYVDKILKGAKPADLPVEQPTTFELVINLRTAQAMGLTIPAAVLFQATEVIR
jgi:putative tryptophan/tyrosine transport system substrate-binding protein